MVYRFIKDNQITHSSKCGRTFLYDNTAFQLIYEGLKDKSIISPDNIDENTDNIKIEEPYQTKGNSLIIEIKNRQIEELTEINKTLNVTLQQQQQLLLYEQQKNTKLLEENIDTKRWWLRIAD